MNWLEAIARFHQMIHSSDDELEAFLQNEREVKRFVYDCCEIGRMFMINLDFKRPWDQENVEYFKFMLRQAIKERRMQEKRQGQTT